eukprot:506373_1
MAHKNTVTHQLITGCYEPNQAICAHCIYSIRQSIMVGKLVNENLVKYIIESNGIKGLVNQLQNSKNSDILSDNILTILINICTSSQPNVVEHVVKQNAIPLLVELLSSKTSLEVTESIIWCLSNIIAEDVKYRDLCLKYNVLDHIAKLTELKPFDLILNRTLAWALKNFVTSEPPKLQFPQKLMDILNTFLHYKDEEILLNVCATLVHLTEQDIYHPLVMNADIKKKLFHFLQHESYGVRYFSLKIFANILKQRNYTNIILKMDMLSQLKLLMNDEWEIKMEACLTLSGITWEQHYIENIINSNLFPLLIENVSNVNENESVRWISLWAITNAMDSHAKYFTDVKIIDAITIYIPEIEDFDLIANTMRAIHSLMEFYVTTHNLSTHGILDLAIGHKCDAIECGCGDDSICCDVTSCWNILKMLVLMPITITYFDHTQLNYICYQTAECIEYYFNKVYIIYILSNIYKCYKNKEYFIAKKFWKFGYRLHQNKNEYIKSQIKLKKISKKCKKIKCSNCNKKGLKCCVGCMKISYCCRQCQKIHWKHKHKYECAKNWIIRYSIFNMFRIGRIG